MAFVDNIHLSVIFREQSELSSSIFLYLHFFQFSIHISFCILDIVGGVVGLAGARGLDIAGGDAAPYLVWRNAGALKHQGASGNDRPLAHLAMVEEGGPHADEGTVVDGAGVDGAVVSDGDVAADLGGTGIVGDMDAGAVLHVGAVAYGDGGHIASHHCIEPDRALVAQRHIAHQGGVLAKIAILAPAGRKSFVRFD